MCFEERLGLACHRVVRVSASPQCVVLGRYTRCRTLLHCGELPFSSAVILLYLSVVFSWCFVGVCCV